MISYLFSVIDKKIYWDKVYELLEQKHKSFEMIFVLKKSCSELEDIKQLSLDKSNVKYLLFEDDTTENFMINDAIKKISGTKLIVCRDYFEYAPVLSDFLYDMGKSGAVICMFKKQKKSNKIKDFFAKIYQKIIKTIFGFGLYEGNPGLIYFGNLACAVLKEINNPSLLTKVNKWKGFDISYALTDKITCGMPEIKSLKKSVTGIVLAVIALVILVVTMSVLIGFNLIGYPIILLFLLFILIDIFILFFAVFKMIITLKVGDLK